MFTEVKKSIEWGGRTLTLETGKIARQAGGSILASYGETVVLCTAVAQREAKEGVDFFPLTVNYQEKTYAAGKIPGGFFKREGRPSEKETLVSRLIDRPLRPLFPDGFYNEVQVMCTVVSHDLENDPDMVALVGASAALAISGVPFQGPVGGARVGYVNGEYVLNPIGEQLEESNLDLVVAGTKSSVLMVESEAKILSEDVMLGAVEYGHQAMQDVITLIEELKSEAGKEDWVVDLPDTSDLYAKVSKLGEKSFRDAYKEKDKQSRVEKLDAAREAIRSSLEEDLGDEFDALVVGNLIKKLEKSIVRGDIIANEIRIDGRKKDDVRQIETEVSLLPRAHGAGLFTRGETQALAVTTLGTGQDQQIIDALEGEYKEKFMLHYNFPPYSVGETGFLRGPGRREIGHGKLAWRALSAVIPSDDSFGYTLRVVSEVTESNGSSSMATVCASSLSMMDAGVPLKAPVAGIAMGLIKEGDDFVVLSDILGDEDHLGDMDFKVAGTTEGVTALQMDIKINGITTEIMKIALEQAKSGRLTILDAMSKSLTEGRKEVNANAPRITTITIDKDKIGALIGPGGKNIKDICETTGAKIDIEDDGTVNVASSCGESSEQALKMIQDLVAEAEMNKIYEGTVVRIVDFGAFVAFLGKNEGLVHVSEIKAERVENVSDVLNEGDAVKVKVIGIDRGKVRLSMKRVDQESGDDLSDQFDAPEDPKSRSKGPKKGGKRDDRGDRGDRGDRKRDGGSKDKDSSDEPKRKKRFF